VKFQTVDGVKQLYFVSHKGGCNTGCFYLGTFTDYTQEFVAEGDYFVYRVAGSLSGTFTDPNGNVVPNTLARFHFETFPAGWQDQGLKNLAAGLGAIDIVLQLD
jgi:hypothetical protein